MNIQKRKNNQIEHYFPFVPSRDEGHTLSAKLLTASIFILFMTTQLSAMQLPMRDFTPRHDIEYVTVAILAKDKAHTLPLYLTCIERQTWPTEKTYLYIRTNNNKDNTAQVLKEWLEKVQDRYAGVYFDDSDVVEQVQRFGHHEWNVERFKVLGKIRQESVDWACAHRSHYFVADCDNFIEPQTIENLVNVNLPIVAPILRTADTVYSNFHAAIDENGYYIECKEYYQLLDRIFRGLVQVPVVHCTYLVRYEVLDKITYDDESYRYEYVIFSDSARKNGIPQYLDTRMMYGYLTCAETLDAFLTEPWVIEHYYDYLSFDQIIYALRMNGSATANS